MDVEAWLCSLVTMRILVISVDLFLILDYIQVGELPLSRMVLESNRQVEAST